MNKRGGNLLSEVCTWTIGLVCALFPSVDAVYAEQESDNAAPLYYQAFLMTPYVSEDDEFVNAIKRSKRYGGPDVAVLRKYTEKYRYTIQLLEDADKLPNCNWAVRGSPRDLSSEIRVRLRSEFGKVSEVIRAHVFVLAADENYKKALSQCLMLRRMTWRFGDDPPFHFAPVFLLGYRGITSRDITRILEIMPPDEKILRWLNEQLAEEPRISDVNSQRRRQTKHRNRRPWPLLMRRFLNWLASHMKNSISLSLTRWTMICPTNKSLTDMRISKRSTWPG